jgi:hypothetical protein
LLQGLTTFCRYVTKDSNGLIVASAPDPPLIIAAGAVSLALGVIANIAILFRLIDTHSVRIFSFAGGNCE